MSSPANLRFLGREASWYHPDLVAGADLVVGKLGYSTVAEAYQAQTPFVYVARRDFRESESLAAFVDGNLPSRKTTQEQLYNGGWLSALPSFPDGKIRNFQAANGAEQAAGYLLDVLCLVT
jgi:hypothetical protein